MMIHPILVRCHSKGEWAIVLWFWWMASQSVEKKDSFECWVVPPKRQRRLTTVAAAASSSSAAAAAQSKERMQSLSTLMAWNVSALIVLLEHTLFSLTVEVV